ncbi:MAG: hypothetical protein ACI4JQ_07990 [Ruminococcus sp.]
MAEINESQTAGNTAEPKETIESLREQLNAAQQNAAEWQQKYEQAEADRKAKDYNDKLDKFVEQQRPRNDLYAAHLKQELTKKNLQFDDAGELVGGDEVIKAMRESYPDAFRPNPNERAVAPTSGRVPQMKPDLFNASFMSSTGFPEEATPSRNTNY